MEGRPGGKGDGGEKEMRRIALRFSSVGLEMGVAVAVGYGAGWWLDKTFGTKPYLTLVMLLVGIGAAFMAVYRAAREFQKMDRDKDTKADETRDRGDDA